MPQIQPLIPLLRPLCAPRAPASRQLFRFSTATSLRADEPTNPRISTTIAPVASVTPQGAKASPPPSNPQEASRGADLAATEAATDADSAQSPAPKPTLPSARSPSQEPNTQTESAATASFSNASSTSSPTPDTTTTPKKTKARWTPEEKLARSQQERKPRVPLVTRVDLPPAKYHVARSSKNNYPIYTDYKRGGNLHITTVRKITGDLSALRDELRVFLNKKNEEVRINALTQHVIVKGHHTPQITEFLKARGM